MVKRAGERVRPTTPTGIYANQQQYVQSSSTERPANTQCLSPEPTGKLDIASWAAAAADELSKSSTAGSASGRPYIPQQQVPMPHSQLQAAVNAHARPRGTDGSGYSAASSQQQQQQHLQKLMYLQQQQQLLQAASSPSSSRRAANSAAAAAATAGAATAAAAAAGMPAGQMRPNSSSSSTAPGQRPAGPFSPLFTGGGMWSSQGIDRSQDQARLAAEYANAQAANAAARQQVASAAPGVSHAAMMGYPEGALEVLDEVPRSRPATSSTMRTHNSSRTPPPAALMTGGQVTSTNRSHYSSTHSVLSAGSYQAAAAAAAAAVVAANARSRGLSPGRGGTLQDVERTYVAAAASAAVNRAMARTPSPGPTRPGYDREPLPPTSRSVSPGREMHPAGFEPGMMAAHRIPPSMGVESMQGTYHPSLAGSAAASSDISSASRPAGLTAAALVNLNGGKFHGAPSPKGVGARVMQGMGPATDLPGAQGWVQGMPQGQVLGSQPWEGSVGSLPMELPPQFEGPGMISQPGPSMMMGPGGPVAGIRGPHPADVYVLEQQQQQQQGGSSSGRRARGHYRSSSDGGGLGVVHGSSNSGHYDHNRPSSDSRLKTSYLRQQEDQQQWQQQQRLRQHHQQQQHAQGKRRSSSSSSDGEEPARWHSTLERLRHQQQQEQQQHHHQQQQQQGPITSDRDWGDEQSEYDSVSGQQLHLRTHKHDHVSARSSPSPDVAEMGHSSSSRGVKLQAASREPSQSSVGPRDDRRGSVHSSCAGSRVSAATSASKAKYQAYPGQAALAYNPKAAGNMSYLHGDKVPQRQRSPVPEPLLRSPEPDHHTHNEPESPDTAAAAHRQPVAPAPAAANLAQEQRPRVNFESDIAAGREQQSLNGGYRSGGGSGGAAGGDGGGKYGDKLEVRVSTGSDGSSGSNGRFGCSFSKRAVWTMLTVLLLVMMAGAGIGVGVAFAKGKAAKGSAQQPAAAVPIKPAVLSMSVFGVTARPALPGMSSDQRCKLWFGSPEKLQQYQQVFSGAYAQALTIPASDIHILGVSCDGVNMLAPGADSKAAGAGAPLRNLLAATAAQQAGASDSGAPDPLLAALLAQPGTGSQPDTTNGVSEVVTRFSVTASSDSTVLSSVTTKVTSWAPNILAAPLAQFYRGAVQVQPAGQLEGWQKLAAPAAAAAPGSSTSQAAVPVSSPAVSAPTVAVTQQQPAAVTTATIARVDTPTAAAAQLGKSPAATAAVQQAAAASTQAQTQAVTAQTAAPAPAAATATSAADTEALDPEEEPEEPLNKQPAKTAAATPPAKTSGGKKTATKKSSAADDDYYPIDSEDAAVASEDAGYEGLDPEEMPIEPPVPSVGGATAATTESDTSAAGDTSANDAAQWVEFYDNAPTCAGVPTIVNSVYDGSGRLWGWEKKAMCVFRATSPQWAPVTWKEAKACSGVPTVSNSVYDESGKLWGWQDGANCAFKVDGKANKPVQLTWKTAANCPGQATSSNSVADLNAKKWGWANGKTCAFRQAGKA